MIFPREYFNKGPIGVCLKRYIYMLAYTTEFLQVQNIAEIYRISGERTRRPERASHGPRAQVRCNELRRCTNKREKAPFFPESGCHAHTCACVPSFPSFLLFVAFRGKKSRCGAVNQSPRDSGASERALRKSHGGPGLMPVWARVLNTSYLADRWVLRLPLAQLVACWLVVSDLHWWTLGFCGTGGAWASISRYATPIVSRKPRPFLLVFAALRAVCHYQSRRNRPIDLW